MSHIFRPFTRQTKHISEVSKAQLGHTVNAQAQHIESQKRSIDLLGKTLIALIQEPEALTRAGGVALIEKAAINRVKPGFTLNFQEGDQHLTMFVVKPEDVPKVEVPQLIIPKGVD